MICQVDYNRLRSNSKYKSILYMELYRHKNSEKYLFLFTIAFILTVFVIRIFLELTGYFKLGGGILHIAHVLWGGLAMLVAGVMILVYQGDRIYSYGSVLLGVGFGFFIDEVGKFITEDNNYFFAPAAAIIYTFMLLSFILSYYFFRRKKRIRANEELIFVLEEIKDIVSDTFHVNQKSEITQRLNYIRTNAVDEEVKNLATGIDKLIESGDFKIKEPPKFTLDSFFFGLERSIQGFMQKHKVAEVILPIYLLVRSTGAVIGIAVLNFSYFVKQETIGTELSPIYFGSAQWLLIIYTALTFVYVLLLLYSFYLLKVNLKKALRYSRFAQIFSILLLNVFSFFFEQFSAAVEAILDIISIYLINIIAKKNKI